MNNRRFSRGDRWNLLRRARKRCQQCGAPLTMRAFHADHFIPWSRGGRTVPGNGQALCPKCNLSKLAAMPSLSFDHYFPTDKPPRQWQRNFLNKFLDRQIQQLSPDYPSAPKPFLLHAFPACGKSLAQLVAAKVLIDHGFIDSVIVIVPWSLLASQMIEDGASVGLKLDDKGVEPRPGHQGVVTTYQKVGYCKNDQMVTAEQFSEACRGKRIMVIADECHHMGDGRNWARGFLSAFNLNATVRLVTSGTPYRSDNFQIPWVEYDNQRIVLRGPDAFSFDYGPTADDPKGALGWCYVRDVAFSSWAKGKVDFTIQTKDAVTHAVINEERYELGINENVDELYPCEFDDDGIRVVDNRALRESIKAHRRHAIIECGTEKHPLGTQYVQDQLVDANNQLDEIRRFHPHASGLIVCKSILHARAVEKALKFHTGEQAVTILSDTGTSVSDRRLLRDFKNNRTRTREKWLIAVAKVSEGVDIPHLRVLVYLSHIKQSMRWTQILGRILRVEQGIEYDMQTAYFFQYDDGVDSIYDDTTEQPLLNPDGSHQSESVGIRLYAEDLMNQRFHALRARPAQPVGGSGGGGGGGGGGTYTIRDTHAATGQEARKIYEGESYTKEDLSDEVRELAAHLGMQPIRVAGLIRKGGPDRWEDAARATK
jgi:superfamily II DNA or RNA helicase